jgi:mono/diheme cytochrome c family protein
MRVCRLLTVALAAGAAALCLQAAAAGSDIKLPPDGVQLRRSALPGYALARTRCVACHSAEYMQYQPPGAPRAYWEGVVKRMREVFQAPIGDADVGPVVDYLVATYGS